MGYGLLAPKYKILGTDISGQIDAVGGNATQFQLGDEVFADISECGFGAFAEYVAIPEKAITLKPANLTFEQAAAVPQAAVVALQGLRDQGQIQPGQKVLINGASGGVGTFAIQIAKSFGAEVTGVCSSRNMDMLRSIGADHVIDYRQEDFTQNEQRYDLIFDIVANRSISDYLRALNPNGKYVACAFNPASLFIGPFISKTGNKKASSLIHKPKVEDLVFIKELLEAGKVVPVIDRCYPLPEIAEAMGYLKAGRHHGKVVITVKEN
jgi:NADPH:quinone reductase-like Zn-dependent oxidoreductase